MNSVFSYGCNIFWCDFILTQENQVLELDLVP